MEVLFFMFALAVVLVLIPLAIWKLYAWGERTADEMSRRWNRRADRLAMHAILNRNLYRGPGA